jgi:hypothetical protein
MRSFHQGKKLGPSMQQFSGYEWNISAPVVAREGLVRFTISTGAATRDQWSAFTIYCFLWYNFILLHRLSHGFPSLRPFSFTFLFLLISTTRQLIFSPFIPAFLISFICRSTYAVSSPCPKSVCLKFGFEIDDYTFVNQEPNTSLAIVSWISGPNDQFPTNGSNIDLVTVESAYLGLETTATAGNETISLNSSLVNGELTQVFAPFASGVQVSYDPLFGIDHQILNLPLIVGLSIGGGLAVIFAVVTAIIVWRRRQRAQYQPIS